MLKFVKNEAKHSVIPDRKILFVVIFTIST